MRLFAKFRRDVRGVTAIEFALIAPILSSVLILGWDGWMMINQSVDMRTAVQTGARYYQVGGSDDTVAQSSALAAWAHKPSAGAMSLVRSCTCDATPTSCSASCAVGATPMTYITLTATAPFDGAIQHRNLTETEVIRVR